LPDHAHRRVHSHPHEAESIYGTDWSAVETSTSKRPLYDDPILQANARELERVRRVVA
jgi:hypothetical protein